MRAAISRPSELIDERLEQLPQPRDSVEQFITAQELWAAVASLPDRLREVLIEVYFKERSGAEVAETLGVPLGTVKSRTFYALRALRAAMRRREGPDD
jgi:RNA polymerase sigma-70 factor (ECF subfamily)